MKFKLFISSILLLFLGVRAQAGAGMSATTNQVPKATAATTNTPPKVATNLPPKVGTNAPTAPKTLEDKFTNSVDMVLLKVGGFWAGKFEVTQKEYQKVVGSNPSSFPGDTRPVDSVSWNDAMDFCKQMTEKDTKELKIPAGYTYTLPTEAEWESLVADSSIQNSVTSSGGTLGGTSPVGSKPENSLGLCDVRGNVAEFVLGDTTQAFRTLRGGSWQDWIEINLRVEFRTYCQPDERKNTFGFRVLLKPK